MGQGREAYRTDASPITAMARYEAGGAINMVGCYRQSDWRRQKAGTRKQTGTKAGIV